ncbi:Hypothetical predicted protein [Olea europaea subsp. europaea]|uniref:Uncharacterized protein n=1 Tax=Olea europaea subsp. europaea TaxID=158383 RepID=A0A8S0SUK0_OLEEU|nr:Hypothetical predicted protein [Olea europaea subsp. europaea]
MAVQRQTAASRSARPWIREQHGVFGGVPMVTPSNPPRRLGHTPNFKASLGQVPLPGLVLGFGFGLGFGWQVSHALVRVKKRLFRTRKRTTDVLLLEAISQVL